MAFGAARVEAWEPAYPPVKFVAARTDFHGALVSEISPEDSVLYLPPGRRAECNWNGVMLDKHIGRGADCERCGARKG